ncbi:MAG: cytochrome c biogenesis protein CcsA [SAR324 cluster bacterium]|nr:cytochrome c biogenesis protein CcsA [SAR324 cluster bacterium]MCZ6645658.1 cytochrome c biogenesis protein CcsA [SAR324 cluster bacterium]MCZ6728547.1 cytochrome c biogenesis protein CcsA [SAR324 cluster bacterium]
MTKVLGWLSLAGFLCVGVLIFGFTPNDRLMGFSQKIMYLHLPSIWITYLSFFVVFYCSIAYLWKRRERFDRIANSAAEIGVLFCGLGILTGAIWGRPTWGTYWVWDARLTTTLLLFLIFVGYVVLRAFTDPGEKQARMAAVIGIVGFLDIPLIHLSVQWWRTLHQPSTMFKLGGEGRPQPAMPPEFLYPLLLSLLVMTVFYGFLLLYRLRIEERADMLAERLAER